MNVEVFFYSLTPKERTELIRLIKGLLLEHGLDHQTLTPVNVFIKVMTRDMSVPLRKGLLKCRKSLPKYIENIKESNFKKLVSLGMANWEEFYQLREKMTNSTLQTLKEYKEFHG